jgi:hypothetical protein
VKHGECHTEFRRREFEDLGIGSGLLLGELVARETKNGQPLGVVVKRTQTCVLRRKASIAGDVDDQTNLILELIERDLLTGDRGHFEVVEI